MQPQDFAITNDQFIILNSIAFRNEDELLSNLKSTNEFTIENDVDTILLHGLGHTFRNIY